MRRLIQICRISCLVLFIATAPLAFAQSNITESHTDWVAKGLKEIQTIKVGMSREELLKVFKEEGGLSTRTWRRYVYRECPYIKVDVEFEAVEAKEDRGTQYLSDRIVKISKPFLEWSIVD